MALPLCSLFSKLGEAAQQKLASHARVSCHSKGEAIWKAADPQMGFLAIRTGLVKMVRPTRDGRSTICGLFGPSETVGELATLKGIPYPASAIVASTNAVTLLIPRDSLLEATQENPAFNLELLAELHNKASALHTKIDVLSAGSVDARLAVLLLNLSKRFGKDSAQGGRSVPIALSRRDLADLVSTSTETAIRTMSRWSREGLVLTEEAGFSIPSPQRLQALLD